jgi:hypothetical protein
MGIAYEDREWEKQDKRQILKLLTDKSASLGKGKEKSSKSDKPHHSDRSDRKNKHFKKKANSKSVDTLSLVDEKTYTDFAVTLKGIMDNL